MTIRSQWKPALTLVLAAALSAGCAGKALRKGDTAKKGKGAKGGNPEAAYTPGAEVTEASLRGSEFAGTEGLQPVRFDYDSAALQGPALEVLKKNADYLKSHPEQEVLVAGHCDERGTVEYNLALGQKRAREVREYYMRLGVPGKAMATISYGKESPACADASEACWTQNRRAETRVRSRVAGNGSSKHTDAR